MYLNSLLVGSLVMELIGFGKNLACLGIDLSFGRLCHHVSHHGQCVTVFLMKMAFVGGMLLEITMALSSMPSSAFNMASIIFLIATLGQHINNLAHIQQIFSMSSFERAQ